MPSRDEKVEAIRQKIKVIHDRSVINEAEIEEASKKVLEVLSVKINPLDNKKTRKQFNKRRKPKLNEIKKTQRVIKGKTALSFREIYSAI